MRSWFFDAQGHVRNGWKVLFFMLGATIVFLGTGLSSHIIPPSIKHYVPNALLVTAGILLVSFVAVRREGVSMANIGMRFDARFCRQLGAGFAIGAGMIATAAVGVWLLGGVDLVRAPQANLGVVVKSFWVFLGVAIFEELSFRGYPLQRAIRGMGLRWAVLIFALIFTAGHLPGNTGMPAVMIALGMFNIFLAALLLSLCYLRTGSLALPIGLHWGWNWLQSTLGFDVSGGSSTGWWMPVFHGRPIWMTGGEFGLEASIVATVVEILVILALLRWQGAYDRALRFGGTLGGDAYSNRIA